MFTLSTRFVFFPATDLQGKERLLAVFMYMYKYEDLCEILKREPALHVHPVVTMDTLSMHVQNKRY